MEEVNNTSNEEQYASKTNNKRSFEEISNYQISVENQHKKQELEKEDNESIDMYYMNGLLCKNEDDIENMVLNFRKSVENFNNEHSALYLGEYYYQNKNYDEMLIYLELSIKGGLNLGNKILADYYYEIKNYIKFEENVLIYFEKTDLDINFVKKVFYYYYYEKK
jgi:hypothetical protein